MDGGFRQCSSALKTLSASLSSRRWIFSSAAEVSNDTSCNSPPLRRRVSKKKKTFSNILMAWSAPEYVCLVTKYAPSDGLAVAFSFLSSSIFLLDLRESKTFVSQVRIVDVSVIGPLRFEVPRTEPCLQRRAPKGAPKISRPRRKRQRQLCRPRQLQRVR